MSKKSNPEHVHSSKNQDKKTEDDAGDADAATE
jgi:hypothetical protein